MNDTMIVVAGASLRETIAAWTWLVARVTCLLDALDSKAGTGVWGL